MDMASICQNSEPNRNITDQVMTETAVPGIRSTSEATNRLKKRKRKRRRNNNRLDETQVESSVLGVDVQRVRNHPQQIGVQDIIKLSDDVVKRIQSLNLGIQPLHSRDTIDRIPTKVAPKPPNDVHHGNEDCQEESNHDLRTADANIPAKRKLGDHEDRSESSKRQATIIKLESAAGDQGEPLTQLDNTNANNQKRIRRDRGRGRKPFSLGAPRVDSDDQQAKDCHS